MGKLVSVKSTLAAVIFLAVTCVNLSYGEEIIFYDYAEYEGSVFTLTITGGCYTFHPRWQKRASSVDVQNGCFMVWDQADCKGKKVKLMRGEPGLQNLRQINFDKTISSVNLCPPEEAETGRTGSKGPGQPENKPDKGSKTTEAPKPQRGNSNGSNAIWDVAVEEHNKYRRRHGVPDLKGDPQMHEEAQKYAEYLAVTNKFESSLTGKYGENLATSFRRDKAEAIRDAITRWYDKNKFYDYERPGYNVMGRNSGSFTAIVWKSTTHLGIGIAWNEIEEQWIVVAFYDPPARRSRFRENVPPPLASA